MGFEVFSFQMQAPVFSLEAVSQFIPFMERLKLHYCIYSFMERSVTAMRMQKETILLAAELLRTHDMELLIHNHNMEWMPDEGTCVMEWLLAEIPSLRFEIDLGWTEYAGINSVNILKKYPDRFPLLHIKEIAKGSRAWTGKPFCTVPGTGILPLQEILDTAKTMPLNEYAFIIDQDDSVSGNIVADISMGVQNIHRMIR
jgi:sugar phosphate isomerase/epimerase